VISEKIQQPEDALALFVQLDKNAIGKQDHAARPIVPEKLAAMMVVAALEVAGHAQQTKFAHIQVKLVARPIVLGKRVGSPMVAEALARRLVQMDKFAKIGWAEGVARPIAQEKLVAGMDAWELAEHAQKIKFVNGKTALVALQIVLAKLAALTGVADIADNVLLETFAIQAGNVLRNVLLCQKLLIGEMPMVKIT
jgi:hypothetical protein